MVYSAGLTKECRAYSMGALKISDKRLFLGRLSCAHLAAFFCLCLAKQALRRRNIRRELEAVFHYS